ncbi:MAG: hypothetical protein KJO98_16260 [Rhodothermia bacterium]|nr:hypothetical protein [Rhodothermia bacterium]
MQRVSFTLLAFCMLSLLASDALAQRYVSATYAVCDMTRQSRADEIVEKVVSPLLDAQVADGTISGWGWLAHNGGGHWRRVLYTVGTDLGDLESARSAFVDKLQADHSSAAREFTSICGAHDDYVWSFVSGATADDEVITNRPDAGLSVYLECDVSQGDRLDAAFDEMAAAARAMKEEGRINSWSYWSHVFGGSYSRLFLIDGASHADNLEAIHDMAGAMATEHADAWAEFNSYCKVHQDYMWDIKMARP